VTATWFNTDPRPEIGKRAVIVILRPHLKGMGQWDSSVGWVETHHNYSVGTAFAEHRTVTEDEKWPQDWWWTWAPEMPK
jgi:hypothetical protein